MNGSLVELVVSSDDYLLEVERERAVSRLAARLDNADVSFQADDVSARDLALEVRSPSLFQPHRILVVSGAERWLDAPAPPERPSPEREEPTPLVDLITEGVPSGVAMVLAGHVGRRPTGPLVDAVAAVGTVTWLPLPEAPKPWEEVAISEGQRDVLRGVVARVAPSAQLSGEAERLLFERLGFAPRQLAQEVKKLAAAGGGVIEADTVRLLTLPRAQSLDVVLDGLQSGDNGPALGLLAAAGEGRSVTDWRGGRLEGPKFSGAFVGMLGRQLEQMAYLRLLARDAGLADEIDPERCASGGWYSRVFKPRVGPVLLDRIRTEVPNPFVQNGGRKRKLSLWYLHRLFRAASHFSDETLRTALIDLAEVERQARGPAAMEAVTRWVLGLE